MTVKTFIYFNRYQHKFFLNKTVGLPGLDFGGNVSPSFITNKAAAGFGVLGAGVGGRDESLISRGACVLVRFWLGREG